MKVRKGSGFKAHHGNLKVAENNQGHCEEEAMESPPPRNDG
ncbi:MAG: hypothetical protein ACE1S7_07265 [Candidatus Tisiphia sp.]